MNKPHILIALLSVFVLSCEINQKDVVPSDSFTKIYNNPDENLSYFVESVLELNDGFLILSGLKNYSENLNEYPNASIIRTNDRGEIVWANDYAWRAPNRNLVDFNGTVGFVAMDNGDNAHFVAINTESGEEISATPLNVTMPLSCYVNEQGNLIVLSYDYISWSSVVSLYAPSFNQLSYERFPVGDDLVIPVQRHLNKNGGEFPFFIGEWDNSSLSGFFVNCLSNYTQGVLFFNNDGASTGGWIYSHQIDNAVSSLLHKEEDVYSITRFYNGKNYITPSINVDVTSLQNYNDSTNDPLHNLTPSAWISSTRATFGATDYNLFASTTNSNSLIIYQYTLDTDELYHQIEIDFADKIEVKQIIQDSKDNGILILAQNYITGRFLRPVLIKVPVRDFKE